MYEASTDQREVIRGRPRLSPEALELRSTEISTQTALRYVVDTQWFEGATLSALKIRANYYDGE